MRQFDVELAIGDSVRVEDHLLTVIDIQGDDITFRLDHAEEVDIAGAGSTFASRRPPR
jgi:hypothetical protein